MASKADKRIEAFKALYLPKLIEIYRPARVFVFGSRAQGNPLKESDLDLLVVSESFEGVQFIQRAPQLLWSLQVPFPIEVLCYTPEEYERKRKEIGVVKVASEEGLNLLGDQNSQ
jgi:predicted nucleotidyltransferase